MVFSNAQIKKKIVKGKKFQQFEDKIIVKNIQVKDPKNQIKKEIPKYYSLTKKAEAYIITAQYAKAKEIYEQLALENNVLFSRDIHNAIRCAILSRDIKTAIWWAEKLAHKGIELSYFNAKTFNKMLSNPAWKPFCVKYDSILKDAKSKWNLKLKQEIQNFVDEDQANYGLTNRKGAIVLYETTETVTEKLISLIEREGFPTEEKIGVFTKKDTLIIQSPEYNVLLRHAVQQKPKALTKLMEQLDKSQNLLEYDKERSNNHKNFPDACFHIYKGNLYIDKSCANNNVMVKKMLFKFKNPYGFIIDFGDFIVSEYNAENPKEWDDYYNNNFNFVIKLTDDWKFYEK
jgi:hypothetical protein